VVPVATFNTSDKPSETDLQPSLSGEVQAMTQRPTSEEIQEKMHQAEELVDRTAVRIRWFSESVGQQVQKAVARAREEAEDIWAEAQEIRNNSGEGS